MALREFRELVVTSDATDDCSVEEAAEVVGSALDDAGFALPEDAAGSPVFEARRFVVSTDSGEAGQAGWRSERHVEFDVDYAVEYGFDPGVLGSCDPGPTVRFTLQFDHDACAVTVKLSVALTGHPVNDAQRRAWERTIMNAWSEHYKLVRTSGVAPCAEYVIRFDIVWDPPGQADQTVRVVNGCGHHHMKVWYEDDQDQIVAHEFGHMLGNIDEYPDDDCPRRPVHPGIMNDEFRWRRASPKHYYLIERFAESSLCSEFVVEPIVPGWSAEGGNHLGSWQRFKSWSCDFEFADLFSWVGGIGG